jgi:hypothetical protein
MSYGELLLYLTSLTNGDLEKTVRVYVANQCLVVTRIEESDGSPVLSTGVHMVDPLGACE